MKVLIKIYEQAIRLLPVAYREQYAEPMVRTLEDMMTDQPTCMAQWNVWLRTMLDLPIITAYQYAQIGGTTMSHTPKYAKQGTLLSALLLLPFIIVITLNSVHPFARFWSGVGYFSIFILPVIALLLSLVILGRLLLAHNLWSQLTNIKQLQNNWILLAVPSLAFAMVLFAFGHDSVHCITDGHLNNLLECVRRS